MSKLFSFAFLISIGFQAKYLYADQCDFSQVEKRENSLLSSYIDADKTNKTRNAEQIQIQFFGQPVILPNRFQVRVNQDSLHLGRSSTFIEYLGCKRNLFATGSLVYGVKKNCAFCSAKSETGIVVSEQAVNPKRGLALKVITQKGEEGKIFTFFDSKNYLTVDDANILLGEFVLQQLSANR